MHFHILGDLVGAINLCVWFLVDRSRSFLSTGILENRGTDSSLALHFGLPRMRVVTDRAAYLLRALEVELDAHTLTARQFDPPI